ncbi:MAG: VWA domain-containing protein [Acholeplasma sp.]|nr:VWA domain-containing protein [Acholeplasma sp.]
MKENLTEIVFIIDRSGSMGGLEAETIGGYNDFLKKQKAVEGEAIISTVLFNDYFKVIHNRVDIKKVGYITNNEYYVGGTTSLYDAIGRSINHIGDVLSKTEENERPSKVIFVIITDGMENTSREFSHPIIKKMIDHQKSKYSWEFIFMGANFDAEKFAESISIERDRSVQYAYSKEGVQSNYFAMDQFVTNVRKNKETDDSWKKSVKQEKENE